MSFDAGAIIFRIQSAGAQLLQRDLAEADASFKKVKQSADGAKPAIDGVGTSTEQTGKKAAAAKAPLDGAAKSTKGLGDASEKASQQQQKQKVTQEQQIQAAKGLSTVLLAAGLAVGAVVGVSVAKFAQFDQAMSNTSAAIMATQDQQKELAAAALDAGAKTAYSATEAANAEEELAKAGQSVADIVGGSLNGALSLAAAGQLQVARSAEIMATTLTQFKLPASQASHVADLLAAGAGKAQGSVDDLAEALQYVGPVASGLGISVEETAGALALFASQGQIGQRAGTGLRGVLMSLTAPSNLASDTMKAYGINIFDSAGNMKSLAGISEILHERLSGLSEAERSAALGRIFGNEQITAARVLYDSGAKGVTKWTDAVNDSGYAAEQAAKRQDNLAGDVEKLGGAFDTAFIQTGSGANNVLREMVQTVTSLVDMYGDLPQPVQQGAIVIGIAAAALLLFYGGTLKAAVGITELKLKLDTLGISLKSTALIAGGVGIALTGVITVVTLLAQAQAEARAKAEQFADALGSGADSAGKAVRKLAGDLLTTDRVLIGFGHGTTADAADALGVSLETVTDAATGNKKALKELSVYMKAAEHDGDSLSKIMDETGLSQAQAYFSAKLLATGIEDVNNSLTEGQKLEAQKNAITAEGTPITKTAAEAYQEAAKDVEDFNTQLSKLVDAINAANDTGQDAISKNLDYKDALAKVDEQIKSVGKAWGDGTQAGRDNQEMLVDLAKKSQDAAKAQFDLDNNTDAYQATLAAGRQALIDRAIAMGATKDQAENLADAIYKIPSKKEISVIADTVTAQRQLELIKASLNYISTARPVVVVRQGSSGPGRLAQADGGIVKAYADGALPERHVAQIARAGEWRVWAEPETEGETYIPWAVSKRARSTEILATTAAAFGYDLVPTDAPRYADGAQTVLAPTSTKERPARKDGQRPIEVHFHNPVVRDVLQDAWESTQIIGAL